MTGSEKTTLVRSLVENDPLATDELIAVYLDLARYAMLERLYPFDVEKDETDIPSRYDSIQCELAARYFLRRGGQGELTHEENGVNRSWGSVDDDDLLQRLTPFAKVGG